VIWEDVDILDLLWDLIDNPAELPDLTPAKRMSLDIYLATAKAPWDVYEFVHQSQQPHHPNYQLLSYATITACIKCWTGVELIPHDMCVNNCYGFTGPLANAQMCPEQGCKEPHFHNVLHDGKVPSVAHKQLWQVLLAPQI
jgi:hypothetical protein